MLVAIIVIALSPGGWSLATTASPNPLSPRQQAAAPLVNNLAGRVRANALVAEGIIS